MAARGRKLADDVMDKPFGTRHPFQATGADL
jgi:hypothetical protein